MKPLHIFLLLFALFTTGLADGIEAGFSTLGLAPIAIPVIGTFVAAISAPTGLLLGMTVAWCLNITMGSGLILLLIVNGMFHPRFGTAGLIGAVIPGLDTFPFLVLVVISGIVYDMKSEGGLMGTAANLVQTAGAVASGNILAAAQGAKNTVATMQQAHTPEGAANDNTEGQGERTPGTLQTKNFDGITRAAPSRPVNDNFQSYVQKAA